MDDKLPDDIMMPTTLTGAEKKDGVLVFGLLTDAQKETVGEFLSELDDMITGVPRSHNIPYNRKAPIQDELDKMLKMDAIQPSESPYSTLVVIVKKKNGSNRSCIDYRQHNYVAVFDTEPVAKAEENFACLSGHQHF